MDQRIRGPGNVRRRWILASASPLYEHETLIHSSKSAISLRLGHDSFGIQHFIDVGNTARVGPPWSMEHPTLAVRERRGAACRRRGDCTGKKTRFAAILLATIISLFFLFLHVPHIVTQPHNPGPWTSGFEVLALCGCALVLANTLPKEEKA